jgi:hypothetical protein
VVADRPDGGGGRRGGEGAAVSAVEAGSWGHGRAGARRRQLRRQRPKVGAEDGCGGGRCSRAAGAGGVGSRRSLASAVAGVKL